MNTVIITEGVGHIQLYELLQVMPYKHLMTLLH